MTKTASIATSFAVTSGDLPGNITTTASLAPNARATAWVGHPGDTDWFRISVVEGQRYTISVDAAAGSGLDAFLRLHDASGRLLAQDDDSGVGTNATLTFVANATTHLYLSAGGYGSSTGAYVVSFTPQGGTQVGTNQSERLAGTEAADRLWGLGGDDLLQGYGGNDRLSGDSGADALYGGAGLDVIDGGTGNDLLFGGTGADRFVFEQGDGIDSLRDFQNGIDRISVDGPLHFGQLTFRQVVTGTWVDYGNGEVFVAGVARWQLDASDFVFV